jgi:hypothetical protein
MGMNFANGNELFANQMVLILAVEDILVSKALPTNKKLTICDFIEEQENLTGHSDKITHYWHIDKLNF